MTLFNIFNISGSGMNVQSKRINLNATNIANIDTYTIKNKIPYPYVAKQFSLKFDNKKNAFIGGVKIDKILSDPTPLKVIYNPNSPMSDKNGYTKISNVNVISEVIDSIASARNYQANIEVINTVKQLLIKTLSIGQ
ncbi:Flagellar basal-body rod protein FlgC [Buchnera aphidicola (Eriosoma grossulariae)]|uniref:flagellar basal body rod protein FlgC n=1 Tax=Buchnera aphidicola TaxID=9 RepID=UPI003463BDE5